MLITNHHRNQEQCAPLLLNATGHVTHTLTFLGIFSRIPLRYFLFHLVLACLAFTALCPLLSLVPLEERQPALVDPIAIQTLVC